MAAAADWLLADGHASPDGKVEYASAVLLNGVLNPSDPRAREAVDRQLKRLQVTDLRALPLKLMLGQLQAARAQAPGPRASEALPNLVTIDGKARRPG